jgi:hypothetical protein
MKSQLMILAACFVVVLGTLAWLELVLTLMGD